MSTATKPPRSSFKSLSSHPKLYVVAIRGPRMRAWKQTDHGLMPRARAMHTAKLFNANGVEAKVLPVDYAIDTTAVDDEPCKVILRPTNADGRKHSDANKTVRRGPKSLCEVYAWAFNEAASKPGPKVGLKAVVVVKKGGN